jgi:signal transduction histidine kinase
MQGDVAELKELVNELLGMTRLDSAEALHSAPFALELALRACIAALPPAMCPVQAEFDARLGALHGDQRLLERALGNVLRNAQKYADVRVLLTARRIHDSAIEIVVEDDGPGVPLDEREKIFAPFYRLDRSRDRASGGFGLGLSIAHKAIALHGGTIMVGEAALGGARFVIRLPIRTAVH